MSIFFTFALSHTPLCCNLYTNGQYLISEEINIYESLNQVIYYVSKNTRQDAYN